MRLALQLHPGSSCAAVTGIAVEVQRTGHPNRLTLVYTAVGTTTDLRLPPVKESRRADELWQTTCFEAFVKSPADDAYYEFNFSPSTEWAAYRFTGYRSGMSVAADIAPRIETARGKARIELRASIDLGRVMPSDAPWRLGLSAVIEEVSGRKSYWALAHPPGRPDFHHADCFALELAGASSP